MPSPMPSNRGCARRNQFKEIGKAPDLKGKIEGGELRAPKRNQALSQKFVPGDRQERIRQLRWIAHLRVKRGVSGDFGNTSVRSANDGNSKSHRFDDRYPISFVQRREDQTG